MTNSLSGYVMILIPLILQLVVLAFAVSIDPYIQKRHRRIMLIIVSFIFGLILQNLIGHRLDVDGTNPYARTVASIVGYVIRPVLLVLFYYIVSDNKKFIGGWALIAVNTLLHLTALFSGVVFRIDENNHFQRGPLGFSCHIISAALLFYLLFLTIKKSGNVRRFDAWIPLFNAGLIIASVVADTFINVGDCPVSFLTIAVVSCSLFYYIWLHLQFVKAHENALAAEQRIKIMMSQIQPHFLYNTLSTIQALCRIDPEQAFDTLGAFGVYLRQNIASLNETGVIPFEKELEHTQVYARIEALRFPSVQVRFEIEDEDFLLPALTVQPLVENAIRHGVRGCQKGIVTISSHREGGCHVITIHDNGSGFNAASLDSLDESHIGIRNVRERVEKICGGSLEVNSSEENGTTVCVRIPAEKEST